MNFVNFLLAVSPIVVVLMVVMNLIQLRADRKKAVSHSAQG